MQVQRQLALLDRVAGIFARIRRQRRQIHALDAGAQVQQQRLGERIDLAGQRQRRIAVDPALDVDGAGGIVAGGDAADAAAQLGQIGAHVRLDQVVGPVDPAAVQHDAVDADVHRRTAGDRRDRTLAFDRGGRGAGQGGAGIGFFRCLDQGDAGRLRRAGKVALDLAEVQPAILAEHGANEEVVRIDRADMQALHFRPVGKIDAVQRQCAPARQFQPAIDFIQCQNIVQRQRATVAGLHAGRRIGKAQLAACIQIDALDVDPDVTGRQHGQRRQVDRARIDIQRAALACHVDAALQRQLAALVDDGIGLDRQLRQPAAVDIAGAHIQPGQVDDHIAALLGAFQQQRPVFDRRLTGQHPP